MLTIGADFSGAESAETSVIVSHYGIIEGDNLFQFVIVQGCVLLSIGVLLVDIILSLRAFVGSYRRGDYEWIQLVDPIVDLSIATLVTVFFVLMLQQKLKSADQSAFILDNLASIPWGDPLVPLPDKKRDFFAYVAELLALINEESFSNMLCNVILLVNLFRVCITPQVDPRPSSPLYVISCTHCSNISMTRSSRAPDFTPDSLF